MDNSFIDFEIKGSHYECGYQYAKRYAVQVRERFSIINSQIPDITDDELAHFEHRFPSYVAELKGISDGAGVDLKKLTAFNFSDDIKRNVLQSPSSMIAVLLLATMKMVFTRT